MQLEQQETFTIKGPQLELFGEIESKLPAPAKKRPTAAVVLAVLALVSVFGIGGARLKGEYRTTAAIYTEQDKYGNSIQNDLETQADAAANLLRLGQTVLGESDGTVTAAAEALETWNSERPTADATEQYTLNKRLYSAVDALYTAAADEADSGTKGKLTDQYDTFTSAQATIERAGAEYNQAVAAYQQKASGFPAALIAGLWGIGDLPAFAAD